MKPMHCTDHPRSDSVGSQNRFLRPLGAALALLLLGASPAWSQRATALAPQRPTALQHVDPALEFLAPYGLMNFPRQTVRALQTFLDAEEKYGAGKYQAAKRVLDELWAEYPVGATSWGNLPTQPFGINIGSPPCYYGLRMLTDMANWRVDDLPPGAGFEPRTVRLSVLLVGQTNGIEPQNQQDLVNGTGVAVVHNLDPRIEANGSKRVHDSLELFREYVFAATGGLLTVETHIVSLPSVNLPVHATAQPSYAGLVDASHVWAHVPAADIEQTDWWWILYPSHVPEQYPAFQTREFITGGIGTGPESQSPYFIIDDRWLLRKPPHLGTGEYSDVEFRAYLPQWLQHEFFHHLFRSYPQFGLEDSSHQWFNLNTWPADFVGRYEADYYHEALTKRLQGATPALHARMRYSTRGAAWGQMTVDDLLGTYRREPVQNPWHIGQIRITPQLRWLNNANVSWNLYEDLANGELLTGPDCPYFNSFNGKQFHVILERDLNGDLTNNLLGFAFNGDLYGRL